MSLQHETNLTNGKSSRQILVIKILDDHMLREFGISLNCLYRV